MLSASLNKTFLSLSLRSAGFTRGRWPAGRAVLRSPRSVVGVQVAGVSPVRAAAQHHAETQLRHGHGNGGSQNTRWENQVKILLYVIENSILKTMQKQNGCSQNTRWENVCVSVYMSVQQWMNEGNGVFLMMHSTHFIYGYIAWDIWLRITQVAREDTQCCLMGYSFHLAANDILCAPSHRQDSMYHSLCYTSCEALERMKNSSIGPLWGVRLLNQANMLQLQQTQEWPFKHICCCCK